MMYVNEHAHSDNQTILLAIVDFVFQQHPEWVDNPIVRQAIEGNKAKICLKIRRFIHHPKGVHQQRYAADEKGPERPIDLGDISAMIKIISNRMLTLIDGALIERNAVFTITNGAISNEHHYLIDRNGRPRHSSCSSKALDPFFSYICKYAIGGETTGIQEFDTMYAKVKKELQELKEEVASGAADLDEEYYWLMLREIISVYNTHHPDNRVFI